MPLGQGELYGFIFDNGVKVTYDVPVTVVPVDEETEDQLDMNSFNPSFYSDHTNSLAHFEYLDPAADGPCGADSPNFTAAVAKYRAGTRVLTAQTHEIHREPDGSIPNVLERHCIRPGRYLISAVQNSFVVEYLSLVNVTPVAEVPACLHAYDQTPGSPLTYAIEADSVRDYNCFDDLIVNFEVHTHGSDNDTPVLHIDTATSRTYGVFSNISAVTMGTVGRFSVARSTSNWASNYAGGRALSRIYWDYDQNRQDRTDYFDGIGQPILRVRERGHWGFRGLGGLQPITIGLEIKSPDENSGEDAEITRTVWAEFPTILPPPPPDLTPGAISPPASTVAGQSPSSSVQVNNTGSTGASQGWRTKVYLSTNQSLEASDSLVATYTQQVPIAAGSGSTRSITLRVPPTLATGVYYLIAKFDADSILREASDANNVGVSATTVSVQGPPIACAAFDGTTTYRMTDQTFNSGCSTKGPNIQYRWQTDSAGAWTAYSSDTLYTFLGHTTSGTKQVTLQVKDNSTGLSTLHLYSITVTNNIITITGPGFVTDKALKTYTSTVSGTWYQRIEPSAIWSQVGSGTTYSVKWNAGQYVAWLRVQVSGGTLGRGRLQVQVCNPNVGCGQ